MRVDVHAMRDSAFERDSGMSRRLGVIDLGRVGVIWGGKVGWGNANITADISCADGKSWVNPPELTGRARGDEGVIPSPLLPSPFPSY